jgi:hypothetical protein
MGSGTPAGEPVPDLVVVGAASRDVPADDPRGWRLGGAAVYCSLTAARLGLRVGCLVGLDEPASNAAELALLEAAGVDLRPVPRDRGPVFENLEQAGGRRQRWLSASDPVPAGKLPAAWRAARGWLLVPVAGEVGEDWASVPPERACLAVGWQGLLRELASGGLVRRIEPWSSALLSAAGLVCGSVRDMGPGVETAHLRSLAPGAVVVLTAGPGGGMVWRGRALVRYPAIAASSVVDPTGAGDVFLATLTAAWLASGTVATPRALRLAAAAGSCAVERAGLAGVPTAAGLAARARLGPGPPESARA